MPSNLTEQQFAAMLAEAESYDPKATQISITRGLASWLLDNQVSLAFTSYQTGQLMLVGVGPDGRVSFNEQKYARATGLCYRDGRMFVGSMFHIWRLENMLQPGQFANNAFDLALVPRAAQTINYIDVHELGVHRNGEVLFVNSRYSCLAMLDDRLSFRPVWKPPFISALAPEDRCHLNGVAMVDGLPAFVTAFSMTDCKDGWREQRDSGGIVMDVASGEIVTDSLSMPHSPRIHDGELWALDSGNGWIIKVDLATGAVERVAFCPGFLRGLAFYNDYVIVTVSKAREGGFKGMPIEQELLDRNTASKCGVMIIDLKSGEVVESIFFDGKITELFEIAVLPGVRNPMSLGPGTVEMIGAVAFDDTAAIQLH